MRGPRLTISNLSVRVDNAIGLFRGQRLKRVLLALAHVVVESKTERSERRRETKTAFGMCGRASAFDYWANDRHYVYVSSMNSPGTLALHNLRDILLSLQLQ